jgi:hypothetical protein
LLTGIDSLPGAIVVWNGSTIYRQNAEVPREWMELTPGGHGESRVLDVAFADEANGLAVRIPAAGASQIGRDAGAAVEVSLTRDGGATWFSSLVQIEPRDNVARPASAAHVTWLDNDQGWVALQLMTGSNFSMGALLHTRDGGRTWLQSPLPIGAPVLFLTETLGWTAGGAAGDQLHRTTDGGITWAAEPAPPPLGGGRYGSLVAGRGRILLAVEHNDGASPTSLWYHAGVDGAWTPFVADEPGSISALGQGSAPGPVGAPAEETRPAWTISSGMLTAVLPEGGAVELRLPAGVAEVAPSADGRTGWARTSSGNCLEEAGGQILCRREARLYSIEVSTGTATTVALPPGIAQVAEWHAGGGGPDLQPGEASGSMPAALGSRVMVFQGQGLDKCGAGNPPEMLAWIQSSPYRSTNLYIGGSSRACANSNLTADLVRRLHGQGWSFIPTWVGPQAPCTSYVRRLSSDPAVAYQQGSAEAQAAADALKSLGLALPDGTGSVVYYDMEAYSIRDTACHTAVKSFLDGWSATLASRGNLSGVYATSYTIGSLTGMGRQPDAIWPANWVYTFYNKDASVWKLGGLSDSLWANHQRIRQYTGGHNETWGGATLNIDCNVLDGLVATLAPPEAPVTMVVLRGTAGEAGWYRSVVQAELSATDPDGVSGIEARLDGGPWMPYSSPIDITDQGEHLLEYRAVDTLGNWEAVQRATVKIDSIAPGGASNADPDCDATSGEWQNRCKAPTFSWDTSDDAVSGVAGYQVYWGADPAGSTGPVMMAPQFGASAGGQGATYLRVRAKDRAGNLSPWATLFVLRFDDNPPDGAIAIPIGGVSDTSWLRLRAAATDRESGVASVRYRDAGGEWGAWWAVPADPLWLHRGPDGATQLVEAQFCDLAGNHSSIAPAQITLALETTRSGSAQYAMLAETFGMGVGSLSSAGYRIAGTLGQPAPVGALSGEGLMLEAGFWTVGGLPRIHVPGQLQAAGP